MKRCPQCNRSYEDDSLTFCLDDGTKLLNSMASLDRDATLHYTPAAQQSAPQSARGYSPSQGASAVPPIRPESLPSPEAVGAHRSRSALIVVMFIFLVTLVGAFLGGRYSQGGASPQPGNPTAPALSSEADRPAEFNQKRAAVDSDPKKWLADNVKPETKPTDSKDPEFLYLYGRALMLSGNHREAMQAFELALNNLRTESKARLSLDTELKLAEAAAALKLKNQPGIGRTQEASMAEQKAARVLDELLGLKSEAPAK